MPPSPKTPPTPTTDHPCGVIISWTGRDGDEHHETWPSIEQFRCWAVSEGCCCHFSAYHSDEDGDQILIGRGRVGSEV